jgi:hypothetical protein
MVDLSLSSDEGDLIADVSRDEEFARRFFGDLNHDVLGPPGDDKIIILSDSNKEEEVRKEKAINIEGAPYSDVRSPTPTAFAVDATYKSNTPNRASGGCNSGGDEAGLP